MNFQTHALGVGSLPASPGLSQEVGSAQPSQIPFAGLASLPQTRQNSPALPYSPPGNIGTAEAFALKAGTCRCIPGV